MKVGVGLPSPQFIINIVIAMAIIALAMRFVPDSIKQYFRI